MADGKISIYMGEGRGKSAAAFGTALLRAAEGKRVVIIQFLKAKDLMTSEITQRLEPEIKFFRFERSNDDYLERTPEEQREDAVNMRSGLAFARKVLSTKGCDLLIMDELLEVINKGIVSVADLEEAVSARGDTDVIITGCSMDIGVCSIADEVMEISPVQYRTY